MRLKAVFFLLLNFLFLTSHSEEPAICLTMIVKNESAIIERCLNSVKEIVDCISICDTGSTDNTVEMIEQFLQEHHIPGKVHHHEWKNFEHNRTLSAESARLTLEELGFSLPNTYLLLLDADMVLVTSPEFKKSDLKAPNYRLIQQFPPHLSFYNVRLINASLPWKCVGVTHEYWQSSEATQLENLKTLWIDDLCDGGSKADKFERDIRLLAEGLEKDPNNARYMFYLAQSYKDSNEPLEAIKWYLKRIDQGGWPEEVWYSKFMIGTIYEKLNQWSKALEWYLDAYQYLPSRAEPLNSISRYYRRTKKHELAYSFAMQGSQIPYPEDQLLFISDAVYDYRFDEDISISAYYTSFKEDGWNANERLLFNKKAPPSVRHQANANSRFYAQNLPNVRLKPISIQRPFVQEGSKFLFNSMNPSILKTKDGYAVVCRCVNYDQNNGKVYKMIDPEMDKNYLVQTRNYLLRYDKNFNLLSQKEIIDELIIPSKTTPYFSIEGLEDVRLFEYNNELWFTCSVFNINHCEMPQICLFRLSESSESDFVSTDHFVHLKGPDLSRCEKNWLPFVKEGEIYVIYSYDPFKIFKVDPLDGTCEQVVSDNQINDFSLFRGSSGPIPFDDGYLSLVHHTLDTGHEKIYFHRFLYLDKNYNITHISKQFTYTHQGVEFCCGMALDHSGSDLIMTVGIEDAEAFFALIDLETVRSLLIPVP